MHGNRRSGRGTDKSKDPLRRKRREMEPPYRASDLLETSQFISYCCDRGIRTGREQLELYDKLDLIIPAVRISRGYVAYRKILIPHEGKLQWREIYADDLSKFSPSKIDPKTYYNFGGIRRRGRDWLDQYEERGFVMHPARGKHRPWGEHLLAHRNELPTTLKELGEGFMDFYAKNQCFMLREVQSRLVVEVRDETLFMNDKGWQRAGRALRRGAQGSLPYVQDAVLEQHRFMRLMNGAHDLIDGLNEEAHAAYEASLKEQRPGGADCDQDRSAADQRREAIRDTRSAFSLYEQESAPELARRLIAECEYSVEGVRKVRQRAADLASELDPAYRWTEYMAQIPDRLLRNARGDYLLALDCYEMVRDLEWLLRMLGDQPPTLKKLVVGTDAHGTCVICGKQFVRKRRTQVTCATTSCVKTHGNDLKRAQRGSSPKNPRGN